MKSITKAAHTLLLFIYLREFGMGLYTLANVVCLCTPKRWKIITEENGKLTIV